MEQSPHCDFGETRKPASVQLGRAPVISLSSILHVDRFSVECDAGHMIARELFW